MIYVARWLRYGNDRVQGGVICSIIKDLCASLVPSLQCLVDIIRADLDTSVAESFREGSIRSHFHTAIAIDGITLSLSKGAALDVCDGSSKCRDVIDPPVNHKGIQL